MMLDSVLSIPLPLLERGGFQSKDNRACLTKSHASGVRERGFVPCGRPLGGWFTARRHTPLQTLTARASVNQESVLNGLCLGSSANNVVAKQPSGPLSFSLVQSIDDLPMGFLCGYHVDLALGKPQLNTNFKRERTPRSEQDTV